LVNANDGQLAVKELASSHAKPGGAFNHSFSQALARAFHSPNLQLGDQLGVAAKNHFNGFQIALNTDLLLLTETLYYESCISGVEEHH
jgi:hypothetical protein